MAGWYGVFAVFFGGRKDRQGSDNCRWNLKCGKKWMFKGLKLIRFQLKPRACVCIYIDFFFFFKSLPLFCIERHTGRADGRMWHSKLLALIGLWKVAGVGGAKGRSVVWGAVVGQLRGRWL